MAGRRNQARNSSSTESNDDSDASAMALADELEISGKIKLMHKDRYPKSLGRS